jgi:hypothetical protein
MRQFEATVETGPYQYDYWIMDAEDILEAERAFEMRAGDTNVIIMSVRELLPITRLEHEAVVSDMQEEINRLQDKLNRIADSALEVPAPKFRPKFRSEYEFIIPSWAISPLFNGDESGLDEEDSIKLDIFLDEVQREYGVGHWSREDDFEPDFRTRNDIDNLGNDCYECKYTVFNKEEMK